MYQNQIIHVIIGFKHDVSCIVRSEARRGHSDTSMHEACSALNNILFTFLMDRGRAPNGIGHLMILLCLVKFSCVCVTLYCMNLDTRLVMYMRQ